MSQPWAQRSGHGKGPPDHPDRLRQPVFCQMDTHIQRYSQVLILHSVAAVSEPARRLFRADGGHRLAYGFVERSAGAGPA